MAQISDLCDRIIAKLSALGSPIVSLLQPGLSDQQIQQALASSQFALPEALVAMYKWKNGTQIAVGATFFPWWTFDTISESVERYKVLSAPNDGLWNDRLFPVFSASDVSSIGILCADVPAADGAIYCFEYTLGTEPEYDSLEAMLRTILDAYENNVIFMNNDGNLDYDESRYAEIARQNNPQTKRWSA
jgi:hypothetical protein